MSTSNKAINISLNTLEKVVFDEKSTRALMCHTHQSVSEDVVLLFSLPLFFLSVNTDSETAVVNVTYATREQARQ